MEERLGRDWPAIAHLNYWKDRVVSEYLMNLMADYLNFQYVTFKDRWGVEPTEIQQDIGMWMAGAFSPDCEPGNNLRGVMAFRSATKTAIASNVIAWLTLLDPRLSIKVVSGGYDLAADIIKECRTWYDSSEILEELLHPSLNQGTAAMQDNLKGFNVPGNPGGKDKTFTAVSILGNITGSRAHIILMDDIEQPGVCGTADKREKLRKYDAEANNTLFDSEAAKASGIMFEGFKPMMLYLGTPHHEESIYTYKESHGYKFRIWPARYPNTEYMKSIGSRVAPLILRRLEADPSLGTGYGLDLKQGRVIDTVRQSEEKCMQDERVNGKSGFAKQFMLDVSLQNIEKYPLKVRDLVVADLDSKMGRSRYMSERAPEFECSDLQCMGMPGDRFYRPSFMSHEVYDYEEIVMTVDTSGRGADETTWSIGSVLNGNIFLLKNRGVAAYQNGYDDSVLNQIADDAKFFCVSRIIIESNFGDGMFKNLLTPVLLKKHKCDIEERRANSQKEVRIIETLEPVMSARKLIVNRSVIIEDMETLPMQAKDSERNNYSLIHQMARITRDRNSLGHDDRLDSLELLVRELSEALMIDQNVADAAKYNRYTKALHGSSTAMVDFATGRPRKSKKSTFF